MEISYTETKIIGNGSFGVVHQAKLTDTGEMVAIKKVLQDKRFKVRGQRLIECRSFRRLNECIRNEVLGLLEFSCDTDSDQTTPSYCNQTVFGTY